MASQNPKTMILVRGLSGSGKTTIADLIVGEDESRISISVDDYFYSDDDEYEFDVSKLVDAHNWCKQEVETCLTQGYEVVVVHNTFTRRFELEKYLSLAINYGYRIHVISLFDNGLTDLQLAKQCVHNVPISNIKVQRRRWEDDVFRERSPKNSYKSRVSNKQSEKGKYRSSRK